MAQASATKLRKEAMIFSQREAMPRKRLTLWKKHSTRRRSLQKRPVDRLGPAAGGFCLICAVASGSQGCRDEVAQVIGVGDDMRDALQPFDQAAHLRTVAPGLGRELEPDGPAERIGSGVDLGGQPAARASDGACVTPLFERSRQRDP